MIAFDGVTGALSITDLGRIAAKYYIRHSSIETFNARLQPEMTEADVLGVLSMSSEVCQRGIALIDLLTQILCSLTRFKFGNLNWKSFRFC